MSDRAVVMECYNKKFNVYKRTAQQTDTHTHFIAMHISCLAFPVHVRQHFEMLKRTFVLQIQVLSAEIQHLNLRTWGLANLPRLDSSAHQQTFSAPGEMKRVDAGMNGWHTVKSKKPNRILQVIGKTNSIRFLKMPLLFSPIEDMKVFLHSFSSSNNLKLQSVLVDISDERLTTPLAAVGLLHTYVTKPYWNLINSSVQYVDFHTYVQLMTNNLRSWCQDSHPLFSIECGDVFDGEFLDEVDTSLHYQATKQEVLMTKCLKVILQKFLEVPIQQLADFMQDRVFGGAVSQEVRTTLEKCPLTILSG